MPNKCKIEVTHPLLKQVITGADTVEEILTALNTTDKFLTRAGRSISSKDFEFLVTEEQDIVVNIGGIDVPLVEFQEFTDKPIPVIIPQIIIPEEIKHIDSDTTLKEDNFSAIKWESGLALANKDTVGFTNEISQEQRSTFRGQLMEKLTTRPKAKLILIKDSDANYSQTEEERGFKADGHVAIVVENFEEGLSLTELLKRVPDYAKLNGKPFLLHTEFSAKNNTFDETGFGKRDHEKRLDIYTEKTGKTREQAKAHFDKEFRDWKRAATEIEENSYTVLEIKSISEGNIGKYNKHKAPLSPEMVNRVSEIEIVDGHVFVNFDETLPTKEKIKTKVRVIGSKVSNHEKGVLFKLLDSYTTQIPEEFVAYLVLLYGKRVSLKPNNLSFKRKGDKIQISYDQGGKIFSIKTDQNYKDLEQRKEILKTILENIPRSIPFDMVIASQNGDTIDRYLSELKINDTDLRVPDVDDLVKGTTTLQDYLLDAVYPVQMDTNHYKVNGQKQSSYKPINRYAYYNMDGKVHKDLSRELETKVNEKFEASGIDTVILTEGEMREKAAEWNKEDGTNHPVTYGRYKNGVVYITKTAPKHVVLEERIHALTVAAIKEEDLNEKAEIVQVVNELRTRVAKLENGALKDKWNATIGTDGKVTVEHVAELTGRGMSDPNMVEFLKKNQLGDSFYAKIKNWINALISKVTGVTFYDTIEGYTYKLMDTKIEEDLDEDIFDPLGGFFSYEQLNEPPVKDIHDQLNYHFLNIFLKKKKITLSDLFEKDLPKGIFKEYKAQLKSKAKTKFLVKDEKSFDKWSKKFFAKEEVEEVSEIERLESDDLSEVINETHSTKSSQERISKKIKAIIETMPKVDENGKAVRYPSGIPMAANISSTLYKLIKNYGGVIDINVLAKNIAKAAYKKDDKNRNVANQDDILILALALGIKPDGSYQKTPLMYSFVTGMQLFELPAYKAVESDIASFVFKESGTNTKALKKEWDSAFRENRSGRFDKDFNPTEEYVAAIRQAVDNKDRYTLFELLNIETDANTTLNWQFIESRIFGYRPRNIVGLKGFDKASNNPLASPISDIFSSGENKNLLKEAAVLSGHRDTVMYLNSAGKMQNNYSLPNSVIMMNSIFQTYTSLLAKDGEVAGHEELLYGMLRNFNSPKFKATDLYKMLTHPNPARRYKIEIINVDGYTDSRKGEDIKDTTSKLQNFSWLRQQHLNWKEGFVEFMRTGTGSSAWGYRVVSPKGKAHKWVTNVKEAQTIFGNFLLGELAQWQKVKDKTNYKYDPFTISAYLSEDLKTKLKEMEFDGTLGEYTDEVLAELNEALSGVFRDTEQLYADYGITDLEKVGMFGVNYKIHQIYSTMMFYGDLNWFGKKFFKRSPLAVSTGTGNTVTEGLYETITHDLKSVFTPNTKGSLTAKVLAVKDIKADYSPKKLKEFKSNVASSVESYFKNSNIPDHLKKDFKDALMESLNSYNDIEVADGQSWVSLDLAKSMLVTIDKWETNGLQKMYDYEVAFLKMWKQAPENLKERYRGNNDINLESALAKLKLTESDIKLLLNKPKGNWTSMKWQYFGPIKSNADVEAYNPLVSLKTSFAPIIPSAVVGTNAEQFIGLMYKDGHDIITIKSAMKTGIAEHGAASLAPFYTKDGIQQLSNEADRAYEIYLPYLKEQLETNTKVKKVNLLASQFRKLLYADTLVPTFDGDAFIGNQWLSPDVEKLFNEFLNIQEQIVEVQKVKLLEELKLERIGKEYIITDRTHLIKTIKDELERQDKGDKGLYDLLEAINKDDNNFDYSGATQMLENFVGGLIKKRLSNIKLPGNALILKASPTTEKLDSEGFGLKYYGYEKAEEFEGFWTRKEVAKDTEKVYLFGDNTADRATKYVPSKTQAVIRGLDNAIGIDTKKNRGTGKDSYFTDKDFDEFKDQVDKAIQTAKDSGKTIVIPKDGIGTGKAMLAKKAPKLYKYLTEELNKLKEPKVTKAEGKISISQGEFGNLLKRKDVIENALSNREDDLLRSLNELMAQGKIPEDLITIFGYRIPTSGLNLMDSYIIKEFLPYNEGSVIILPPEAVIKAGEDYDIDKKNFYFPSISADGTRLPVLTEKQFTKNKEELQEREEALSERYKELTNSVLEVEGEGLTGKEIEQLREDLRFDNELEKLDIVDEYALVKEQLKTYKNYLDYRTKTLTNKLIQNAVAATLVPERFFSLVTPVNNKHVEDSLKEFGQSVEPTPWETTNISTSASKREDMVLNGQALTGFVATDAVALQVVLKKGLRVNKDSKLGKTVYPLLTEEEVARMDRGDYLDLSNPLMFDGMLKSDVFNQYTQATIDAANSPLLSSVNITKDTIPVMSWLTMVGIPVKRIGMFLTQPILRERQRLLGQGMKSTAVYTKQGKALLTQMVNEGTLKSTKQFFGGKDHNGNDIGKKSINWAKVGAYINSESSTGDGKTKYPTLTNKSAAIEKKTGRKIHSSEAPFEQLYVLWLFHKHQNESLEFLQLKMAMGVDTNPDRNSLSIALREKAIGDINSDKNPFIDKTTINKILKKSEVSPYYQPEITDAVLKALNPIRSNATFVSKFLQEFGDSRMKYMGRNRREKFIRTATNDFLDFLVKTKVYIDGKPFNQHYNSIRKDIYSRFRAVAGPTLLRYTSVKKDGMIALNYEAVEDGFTDTLKYELSLIKDSDPVLYRDLLVAFHAQYGYNFTIDTLQTIIPKLDFYNLVKEDLAGVNVDNEVKYFITAWKSENESYIKGKKNVTTKFLKVKRGATSSTVSSNTKLRQQVKQGAVNIDKGIYSNPFLGMADSKVAKDMYKDWLNGSNNPVAAYIVSDNKLVNQERNYLGEVEIDVDGQIQEVTFFQYGNARIIELENGQLVSEKSSKIIADSWEHLENHVPLTRELEDEGFKLEGDFRTLNDIEPSSREKLLEEIKSGKLDKTEFVSTSTDNHASILIDKIKDRNKVAATSLKQNDDTKTYVVTEGKGGKGGNKLVIPKFNSIQDVKDFVDTIPEEVVFPTRGLAVTKSYQKDFNQLVKEKFNYTNPIESAYSFTYNGTTVPTPFELSKEQSIALEELIDHVESGTEVDWTLSAKGGCLAKGTKVVMFDGTFKNVEDVEVGDLLMGPDSTPRTVLDLRRGREQMYWVRQTKGDDYRVNERHILSLKKVHPATYSRVVAGKGKRVKTNKVLKPKRTETLNISVKDYLNYPTSKKHIMGYMTGVEFSKKETTIDPYYLGLWLGDGSTKNINQISNIDKPILDYLFSKWEHYKFDGRCTYTSTGNKYNEEFKKLYNLTNAGKLKEKYIPTSYLYNTREIRLQLLAGLIDSDGHLANKTYEITQKHKKLAHQIAYLCRSLGLRTYIRPKKVKIREGDVRVYWRITFNGTPDVPTKLPRKQCDKLSVFKERKHTSVKLEKDVVDDYYGFTLDKDHLFLLEDFTVTHNTGKTSIIGVLGQYLKSAEILYLAPTHAVTVELAIATLPFGNTNFPITIPSSKATTRDGTPVLSGKSKKILKGYKEHMIMVVDEASMVNDKDYDHLTTIARNNGIKIIFLGDYEQFAPIGQKHVAKPFLHPRQSTLTKSFRQGEGGLIDYLTEIRKHTGFKNFKTEDSHDLKFLNPSQYRKTRNEIILNDSESFTEIYFRNKDVEAANTGIRSLIGREGSVQKNDIVIGYLGYANKQITDRNLANSVKYKVIKSTIKDGKATIVAKSKKLSKLSSQGIRDTITTTVLALKADNRLEIPVTEEQIKANKDIVGKILRAVKEENDAYAARGYRGKDVYKQALREITEPLKSLDLMSDYVLDKGEVVEYVEHLHGARSNHPDKSKFNPGNQGSLMVKKGIDYGHAITSIKSQGSTLEVVGYDPQLTSEMYRGSDPVKLNGKTISTRANQNQYVIASRAKNLLVRDNGSLEKLALDKDTIIKELDSFGSYETIPSNDQFAIQHLGHKIAGIFAKYNPSKESILKIKEQLGNYDFFTLANKKAAYYLQPDSLSLIVDGKKTISLRKGGVTSGIYRQSIGENAVYDININKVSELSYFSELGMTREEVLDKMGIEESEYKGYLDAFFAGTEPRILVKYSTKKILYPDMSIEIRGNRAIFKDGYIDFELGTGLTVIHKVGDNPLMVRKLLNELGVKLNKPREEASFEIDEDTQNELKSCG